MPTNCPVLLTEIQVLQAEIVDINNQIELLMSQRNQKQTQLSAKQVEYFTNCT